MTVTPEQIARRFDQREGERQAHAAARAQRLLDIMHTAVLVLRQKYGPVRVTLFGSLATGEFRETSDVDLAVEGLDGSKYFAALTDLMTEFQAPVDLVRPEEASSALKAHIVAHGRPL